MSTKCEKEIERIERNSESDPGLPQLPTAAPFALTVMNDDDETYILLLLSDSNLPTGSFVASSGLESYVKHGFYASPTTSTISFIQDSLGAYAHNALPFVSDAHRVVESFKNLGDAEPEESFDKVLNDITALDNLYEAMTLNHVARRASKSQGVALLTLYSKGFSRPPSFSAISGTESWDQNSSLNRLLEKLKQIARGEETHAHLPVCWGVLTAALGLSLERSQYLHLFLHARSLLSASVRLNDIGPYSAQQLLMHLVRPLVARTVTRCKDLRSGVLEDSKVDFDEKNDGPANTWPLGEILAARHDLQHSRIFNS